MPKYVVRYGIMRSLGVFGTRGHETYVRTTRVIARTNRGLEAGEVRGLPGLAPLVLGEALGLGDLGDEICRQAG